tara:strand:+ start:2706 stop:4676 length:1971 start_codon:yes stop_codon:yes gene_type:complete
MKIYILGSIIISVILFILFLILLIHYRHFLINKKIKSYVLVPLRLISIIILLTLLLEPYLFYYDYSIKDKINIYIDNSKSIRYSDISPDSLLDIAEYFKNWNNEERDIEVQLFTFGDSIRSNSNRYLDLNDNVTNFLELKSHLDNSATNFIISDGNSTEGYKLSDLKFDSPINFIGLGFLNYEDISINDVKHSHFISNKDSLLIEFTINSVLEADNNSKLLIISNELNLYQENIKLDKGINEYYKTIKIPVDHLNTDFEIKIENSLLSDNKYNNIYNGGISIRDIKSELLLISGSLNANTQSIKNILNLIPNFNLNHIYKKDVNWNLEDSDIKFEDYEIIVFDNFPLDYQDSNLMDFIISDSLNMKYIIFEGPSANLNSFNQIDKKISVDIVQNNKKDQLLSLDAKIDYLSPSINRNFKIYEDQFEKIYMQYSDSSIAVGETGIYLYLSIPDLSSLMIKDFSNIFKKEISNIIYKYIDSGNSIILDVPNRKIHTNQKLEFYLEIPDIYSDYNGELLIDNIDSDTKYNLKFSKIKVDSNGNKYIDNLKTGKNVLSAILFDNQKSYNSNQVELVVKENNLELQKNYRNINTMKELAINSNGNYYDIEQYKSINSSILGNIKQINKKVELDIHSFDKFWFILLITLIIEWFFRKKKGLL